MTVSGEKAPIKGKMRKVCSTARAPRIDPRWVQAGTVTGGGLVVPKFSPPVGCPAKGGARAPCPNIASVATTGRVGKVHRGPWSCPDGSAAAGDRKRVSPDQPN